MMVGGDGVLSDARAGAGGGGGGAAMLLSLCGDEERAYAARDQNTDPCLAGGLLLIWEPLAPYSRALRASTMRKQAYARARSLAFHGWSASAVFERHTTRPQFMMCTAARKGGTMCVSILMFAASPHTFLKLKFCPSVPLVFLEALICCGYFGEEELQNKWSVRA